MAPRGQDLNTKSPLARDLAASRPGTGVLYVASCFTGGYLPIDVESI